jgi:hypothetical protein
MITTSEYLIPRENTAYFMLRAVRYKCTDGLLELIKKLAC